MNINEINNHRVKLSPRSITIKDDSNKTRGVVRAVCFKECKPNLQIEVFKIARSVEADLSNFYYSDNKWWYIHNKCWDANYFKYFEGRDPLMDIKYQRRQEIYKILCAEPTIEVIECYIV